MRDIQTIQWPAKSKNLAWKKRLGATSPSCCKSGEDLEHPLAPASYTPRPDLLGPTCGELSPRKCPLKYWRQQWWKMQCKIRRPQRSVQGQITASWSHCTGIAISHYPTWLLPQNNPNSYQKDGSIDDFERKHLLTQHRIHVQSIIAMTIQ